MSSSSHKSLFFTGCFAKQPVKNKDLWLELDILVSKKEIEWKWVKGHSNDHYNTIVDEAARKAIR